MEKTCLEWFETLPEGNLKDRLMANIEENFKNVLVTEMGGMAEAIGRSFQHSYSPEGLSFWRGVCAYFNGVIDTTFTSFQYKRGYNLAKSTFETQAKNGN